MIPVGEGAVPLLSCFVLPKVVHVLVCRLCPNALYLASKQAYIHARTEAHHGGTMASAFSPSVFLLDAGLVVGGPELLDAP